MIGTFKYTCRHCGEDKESYGPVPDCLCDGCWELDTRIRSQPQLARKILKEVDDDTGYSRGQ